MGLETAGSAAEGHTGFSDSNDRIIEQRLAELLRLNAEIARDADSYPTERDRIEVSVMASPIDSSKAFGYFGLLIGTLPPFALVLKVIGEAVPGEQISFAFLGLLALAGIVTGLAGYASRRIVSSAIANAANLSLPNRISVLSFIGLVWGAASGAIGGLILLLVGSIFAGIAGGVVGAVALPAFVGLRSSVLRGEFMEMKHFLPIAFGITFTLCGLILGM